jgi:hypothetical protein
MGRGGRELLASLAGPLDRTQTANAIANFLAATRLAVKRRKVPTNYVVVDTDRA